MPQVYAITFIDMSMQHTWNIKIYITITKMFIKNRIKIKNISKIIFISILWRHIWYILYYISKHKN